MDWIDEVEKEQQEAQSSQYFNVEEGDNRVQILTSFAKLVQRWNPSTSKYEIVLEGDDTEGRSIKGVAWVLQDGKIKLAKLPYTVVKQIRALQLDPDYSFEEFPMPRAINIKTKNARTKEVEYTVIPSPKESVVSDDVLKELGEKDTPEQVVETMKSKAKGEKHEPAEVDPEDIPF